MNDKLSSIDALSTLQKQYALLRISGAVSVVDLYALGANNNQGGIQKLETIKRSEATLLLRRTLAKGFPQLNTKAISEEFFFSPSTTCFEGVEVNPVGTSPKMLNLWVSPVVKPAKSSSKKIRTFLRHVICAGNKEHYEYLKRYLAHMLQYPEEKPGVMVILLGGQGTGKGTFGRILQKIWAPMYLQVHQIRSVVGDFNASLERAFIVWLDEAFFEGDRVATDSLKSLVTEPYIHVNEKFQPARQIRSYHRFFGASNSDYYKSTERDDRRDFVLRVSDRYKGDHAYWTELNAEIQSGGVADFVRILNNIDLSDFNVRDKPHTNELMRQKLKSLRPVEKWWFECLCRQEIHGGGWPKFLSTVSAVKAARVSAGLKVQQGPSSVELAKILVQLCPSASKKQQMIDGERQRGFLLPALDLAKTDFEHYMGGAIDW